MKTATQPATVPAGYVQLHDAGTLGTRVLLPAHALLVAEPAPGQYPRVRVTHGGAHFSVDESYEQVLRLIAEAVSR